MVPDAHIKGWLLEVGNGFMMRGMVKPRSNPESREQEKPSPKNRSGAKRGFRIPFSTQTKLRHPEAKSRIHGHSGTDHRRKTQVLHRADETAARESIPDSIQKWHPESQALWLSWQRNSHASESPKSLSELLWPKSKPIPLWILSVLGPRPED